MAIGTIMPAVVQQYLDDNANALSGGFLYSWLAGTSTPTPTYTDAGLTVPHPNPIVLNIAGRTPQPVFLDALSYKFELQDSLMVTIWTVDGVQATQVSTSGFPVGSEIFSFGGDSTSQVVMPTYAVGTTVDKTHAGTALYNLDSGNLPAGTYVLEGMLLAGGGGSVTAAIVNLSDGAPQTPLASITSSSTTGALVPSSAITFAGPGAAKNYAIKTLITGVEAFGYAWGLKIRRTI